MAPSTLKTIKIYGGWVLVCLAVSAYGVLFENHGEYGISSHIWLTITGFPMSLLSWFIVPNGTFIGSLAAGTLGLVQWAAIAEGFAMWGAWRK
ncbi:hypothetical protein [Marinobacterium sedimentorum]|uniref:hypothetical protein n=1 Tax=Marinobacterium sedimentorum TaxID=2927804 RepID=UPI0020C72CFD|nr:hypothetical protein [Marinobacterium sedimentorum]MCP8686528.1 hypothetical protein [Marinobacterium sedimentorum]